MPCEGSCGAGRRRGHLQHVGAERYASAMGTHEQAKTTSVAAASESARPGRANSIYENSTASITVIVTNPKLPRKNNPRGFREPIRRTA